jgi:endonuclease/exonuclease/phosphatase family metal-dependent hydrolase
MSFKAKNTKLNILYKTVLILNCLAAFALIVCYTAPYINPASFWPPAFFSMAYIPILFINAVFLVFWMLRTRIFALISGMGILLGSGFMVHNIGFHKQSFELAKASPQNIRVMTYNVYNFLNQDAENYKDTYNNVLQLVKTEQPDIVNMQEYFTHNSDHGAMEKNVKGALNTQYSWFKAFKTTPYDSTGLAVFSKYPIINRDTIPQYNGIKTEGIFIDVKKDGKILRVYNFHLQSTQFDRDENAYLDNLSHDGKPSLHQTRHIGGKLKLAFMLRGEQVIGIKQQLDKCPYPYILTGDFNDTPLSFSVNYMAKGLKNAFREKGYGLGVTYYGEYPGFQLDYIMTSPAFDVTNYTILRQKISDHYPVLSDLALK